jgi:predicted transcriptional regulator
MKTDLKTTQLYYIEFLNKDKNFQRDKKIFDSYELAIEWGKSNFENFNIDMINYNKVASPCKL